MSTLVKKLYSLERSNKKALTLVDGKTYTYKNIFSYSHQLATYFQKEGLGSQDRVLLLIKPGLQAASCTLACLKLGIGVILIDPESSGQEIFKQKIKVAKPTCIIVDYRLRLLQDHPVARFILEKSERNLPNLPNLKPYKVIVNKKIPLLGKALPSYIQDLPKEKLLPATIPEQKEALIVFTSGTTSAPKAVVHTHQSLVKSLDILGLLVNLPKPILYTNQIYFLFFALALKAQVIFDPEPFTGSRFVKNSLKYKPTITFAPPGELIEVLRYCRQQKLLFPKSYKHVLLGSAPVTKGFLKKLFTLSSENLKTTCLYGMTEVLPIATIDGFEKLHRKINGDLLGKPVQGVKLRVDKQGVLHIGAEHLCSYYLNGTKHAMVSTGDIVRINGKKEIILKGRQKDMILRRSFNIYPALYEPIIESIPGVDTACMVGLYKETLEDEDVVLVLEADPQLKADSIKKKLSSGKYSIDVQALPDQIIFMTIPRVGRQKKINKQLLREKLTNK